MCYFIIISTEKIFELPDDLRRKMQSFEICNPTIQQNIPTGFVQTVITSGGCSCDLFSPLHESNNGKSDLKGRIKSYEKKGWSKTKIERALSQIKVPPTSNQGLHPDVEIILNSLSETQTVYALVRFFEGDITEEKFEIVNKNAKPPMACENTLYKWVRGNKTLKGKFT